MIHQRPGREERLHATVQTAEELRPLMTPAIQAFFDRREAALIDKMITAKPADDDERRSSALELAALRQLRSYIVSAIRSGATAATKLEEMKHAE